MATEKTKGYNPTEEYGPTPITPATKRNLKTRLTALEQFVGRSPAKLGLVGPPPGISRGPPMAKQGVETDSGWKVRFGGRLGPQTLLPTGGGGLHDSLPAPKPDLPSKAGLDALRDDPVEAVRSIYIYIYICVFCCFVVYSGPGSATHNKALCRRVSRDKLQEVVDVGVERDSSPTGNPSDKVGGEAPDLL
jgi:hypothetical protein